MDSPLKWQDVAGFPGYRVSNVTVTEISYVVQRRVRKHVE